MLKESKLLGLTLLMAAAMVSKMIVAAPAVAVYSLPVPSRLESVSSWTVTNVSWDALPDGHRQLTYRLPAALGAAAGPITLSGIKLRSSQFIRLDGVRGTAYCTETTSDAVCLVSFDKERLNLSEQRQFLRRNFATSPDLSRMEEVLLAFLEQPVGILRVTFSP